MTNDLTLEKLQNTLNIITKSCKEKHLPREEKVLFNSKAYDILEKNLEEPLLTEFKRVAYRCPDMP